MGKLARLLPPLLLLLLLSLPPEQEQAAVPELISLEPVPVVQIIPPLAGLEPEPEADGPPACARVIEGCTVTWYTEDTCGKSPDHPAYGITASGLPVEEGVTCAVDPNVIPLYSDVYVEYSDGSVGRFRATDTGVSGAWVDIYTPDYNYAVQCGLQTLTVWFMPPEE